MLVSSSLTYTLTLFGIAFQLNLLKTLIKNGGPCLVSVT